MRFTKMQGLGNDFVVIWADQSPEGAGDLARRMCDRHFGVGADGLVFLLPSNAGDVQMRILNSDGSEAEQCGNAIRCVATYYYERISGARQSLSVETKAGLQKVWLETKAGQVSGVRVDMGEPILEGKRIPVSLDDGPVVDHPVEVEGTSFPITAVSMGNPHAVIFVEDAAGYPVETWGPRLEKHPFFPNHTNVEFVSVRAKDELEMRVWERGVGQTLACGTGACASAVAAVLNGETGRQVLVHLKGGDLTIEWDESDNRVYMTGPAQTVFEGEWAGDR